MDDEWSAVRLRSGTGASPGWRPLDEQEIFILVGLTGVGKTTAAAGLLDVLSTAGGRGGARRPSLLPNRRALVDLCIVPAMLAEAGRSLSRVRDRRDRFALTRRYREMNEGGVAHALAQLEVDPEAMPAPCLFDGLRGLDEVRFASRDFPRSRFLVLDAPDDVRLRRLLGRAESFDRVDGLVETDVGLLARLQAIDGVEAVFDEAALAGLCAAPEIRAHEPALVVEKAVILVEERRNYDSAVAASHLASSLPASRLLSVDTARRSVHEATADIVAWWSTASEE